MEQQIKRIVVGPEELLDFSRPQVRNRDGLPDSRRQPEQHAQRTDRLRVGKAGQLLEWVTRRIVINRSTAQPADQRIPERPGEGRRLDRLAQLRER